MAEYVKIQNTDTSQNQVPDHISQQNQNSQQNMETNMNLYNNQPPMQYNQNSGNNNQVPNNMYNNQLPPQQQQQPVYNPPPNQPNYYQQPNQNQFAQPVPQQQFQNQQNSNNNNPANPNQPPEQVVIQTHTVTHVHNALPVRLDMYRDPAPFKCECGYNGMSSIRYSIGNGSMIIMCILFFFLCMVGALLVFCFKDCQNVTHNCPRCQRVVGENQYEPCH